MPNDCSNNLKRRIESLEKIMEAWMIIMKDNIALQRETEARLSHIEKNYIGCRHFDRQENNQASSCICKVVKFALTRSIQSDILCIILFFFSVIFLYKEIF